MIDMWEKRYRIEFVDSKNTVKEDVPEFKEGYSSFVVAKNAMWNLTRRIMKGVAAMRYSKYIGGRFQVVDGNTDQVVYKPTLAIKLTKYKE